MLKYLNFLWFFPDVKLNDARLLSTALAGPVTTSNDETPESSNILFIVDHIGSRPYAGLVLQLNILSTVLELIDPDKVFKKK